MKIIFTNDHAATEAREGILAKLKELGHEVIDMGTPKVDADDYPDKAAQAAKALMDGRGDRAILACGSGIGMSIVANRFPHVRCAMVTDEWAAEMSRRHNDANCLAIRAREQDPKTNLKIIEKWLATDFEGGRHARRVEKIDALTADAHDPIFDDSSQKDEVGP